jgi:hypothetical protein
MENMYLHSCGPLRTHVRKSGEEIHYRDAKKDTNVELYWTLPPQEIEVLSDETERWLQVSELYHDRIKEVIGRLQRLEWLFINARLPEKYHHYRELLIERIRDYYNRFAVVEAPKSNALTSSWYDYACGLFELPRNDQEKNDFMRLKSARDFVDTLYIAMADGWEFVDEVGSEQDRPPLSEDEDPYDNPLETLAAYLSVDDKKKLCKIVNRSYVEPLLELKQVAVHR